ncbi:MAG: hypothetical protein ABIX46_14115 [Burkholderiaceae bacterium]
MSATGQWRSAWHFWPTAPTLRTLSSAHRTNPGVASVSAPLFGGHVAFTAAEQTHWDGPPMRSATLSLGRGLGPLASVNVVATRLTGEICGTRLGLTLARSLALRAE